MATDPDLQSLIDARKRADKAKEDARTAEAQRQARLTEKNRVEKEAWDRLLRLLNEEAGRVNSVSDDTGIVIKGMHSQQFSVGLPAAGYQFTTKSATATISVVFVKQDDGFISFTATPNQTSSIEVLNYRPQHPARQADEVPVRAIFNEVAQMLIKA